jgi:hypothetical protein
VLRISRESDISPNAVTVLINKSKDSFICDAARVSSRLLPTFFENLALRESAVELYSVGNAFQRLCGALDHARDCSEEAVRDGHERLVEMRARVRSARDRDENVQDPGAADVHAHARYPRVAGSYVHQCLSEVLQEKTDREHVLVADADAGVEPLPGRPFNPR